MSQMSQEMISATAEACKEWSRKLRTMEDGAEEDIDYSCNGTDVEELSLPEVDLMVAIRDVSRGS